MSFHKQIFTVIECRSANMRNESSETGEELIPTQLYNTFVTKSKCFDIFQINLAKPASSLK